MSTSNLVMARVQSIRQVASVRGYPYFAWGLYEVTKAKRGHYYYRLIASRGRWRSNVSGSGKFDGVRVVKGVRHGKLVMEAVS